jgi:nicotinamidase-related amidase
MKQALILVDIQQDYFPKTPVRREPAKFTGHIWLH